MSIDVSKRGLSESASNLSIFKEQGFIVSSNDYVGMLSALKELCRVTGFMCYSPLDAIDVDISLAWAETLQYLDDPASCIKSLDCCHELIESFVKVVKIAIESQYVYQIDLAKLEKALAELKAIIRS